MPPAAAIFSAADRPMPLRGAGDDDRLAVDRALERAVLEEVGVEVALPVVPELVGVGVELAARRCPVPSSARSVSRVSNAAVSADVLDDLLGDPEVGEERLAHVLERRAAA